MGANRFVLRWLTEAGVVLTLSCMPSARVFPQVIIRDTIHIDPKPPQIAAGAAAEGGGTIRLTMTVSGRIDTRPIISSAIWMNNQCGDETSGKVTGPVTTVQLPARAGVTTASTSFRVLQSPSMFRTYAWYLDDELIDSVYLEASCPVACLFQGQIGAIPLYSSFQVGVDQEYGESTLNFGKSTGTFEFKYSIAACSPTVWSPGSRTTISIVEGAGVGTLVNAAGEDVGDQFTGTAGEIRHLRFVANGTAHSGTNSVVLEVSSRGISSSHTIEVFKPLPAVHHFEVTASPDTIHHGETSTLFVRAKDEQNHDLELPDSTILQMYVSVERRQFGELWISVNGDPIEGTELAAVSYRTARSGGVVYVADGVNPIGMDPQLVPIGVLWTEDGGVGGLGKVAVECKVDPPRYAQGDPRWGRDWYDSALNTNDAGEVVDTLRIKDLGCALSCMAMAMTAFGDTITPKGLNGYMKDSTTDDLARFDHENVRWEAILMHSDDGIVVSEPKDAGANFDLAQFHGSLEQCRLIIAKVFNPESVKNKSQKEQERAKSKGNHWVLLKAIQENGYVILDPGRGLKSLSEYGRIYRYVQVYSAKGGKL